MDMRLEYSEEQRKHEKLFICIVRCLIARCFLFVVLYAYNSEAQH